MLSSQRFGAESRWINKLCGLDLIKRIELLAIRSLIFLNGEDLSGFR
jgi:hypothetical protein